jgi:hypothetical protein
VRSLQSGPLFVGAFLSVLKNVTKDETVQYVLALLDSMLEGECPPSGGPQGGQ